MSWALNGVVALMALLTAAGKDSPSSTGLVANCVGAGANQLRDGALAFADWRAEVSLEVDVGKLACKSSLGPIVF